MKRIPQLLLALILGVCAVIILLFGVTSTAHRTSGADYAEIHVCPSGCPYSDLQAALDAANPGDTIKVATGVYTALHTLTSPPGYPGTSVITQVAYMNKSISLLGGFTTSDWEHQNPIANPTTLDAGGKARVVIIFGEIHPVLAGFTLTHGNPRGSGGFSVGSDAGGGILVISSTVDIHDNQIFSNTASAFGAGIALINAGGSIDGNSIFTNTSHLSGGGIYARQCQLTVSSNTIASNRIDNGWGGGIFLVHSTITLTHNSISSNQAISGSGVSLNMTNGVISENSIDHNIGAGAVGIEQYGGESVIQNNLIRDNQADSASGGGILVDGVTTLIEGNTVISNTAGGMGGGMSVGYGHATVRNNIIANNISSAGGGGVLLIYNEGAFSQNQLINNTSLNGGGGGLWVYFCGSRDLISHNLIQKNNALAYGGGGILTYNCDGASFIDNRILENYSNSAGGGMYFDGSNNLTVSRNIVRDNLAGNFGGGVYGLVRGDWINNVIVGNSAPTSGSGMYLWASNLNLLHNTISSNVGGDETGIVLALSEPNNSTVNMTNTILVSQTIGILAVPGNQVSINGILWFNNGDNTSGGGTFIINNPIIGDPLFQPDGYHLQSGSNAIDNGVDSNVHMDIDAQPRPYQAYDLGADEFWPLNILKNTFLPFLSR